MNDETIALNLDGFADWLEKQITAGVTDRDLFLLREAALRIREMALEIQSLNSGPSHPF